MTFYTTITLIPTTASGADILGNAVPAANYYGGQGALQTLTYTLDTFQGNILVQATLSNTPEQAVWFEFCNRSTRKSD
jgi:hypothetical protein